MAKCSRKPRFSDFGHRHVQFQRLPVAHSFFFFFHKQIPAQLKSIASLHSHTHTLKHTHTQRTGTMWKCDDVDVDETSTWPD